MYLKKTGNVICSIMACLLLFASCDMAPSGTAQNTDSTAVQVPDENHTASVETTIAFDAPQIAAVDAGGRDFVCLTREVDGYTFPYPEINAGEENGEVINDAIYRRNTWIEEKYHVHLVSDEKPILDLVRQLERAVRANDAVYDAAFPMISTTNSLVTRGYLYEISEIPHINTAMPWWMSNILANTSVGGKNYYAVGDINLSALDTVGITYFNKMLADELDLPDIYQIVREGAWTFDKLAELSHNVSADLNGDGALDENDRYGLVCNAFVWQPLFFGTASHLVESDKDGVPRMTCTEEQNVTQLAKIVQLLNDRASTILVNQYQKFVKDPRGFGPVTVDMFTQNQALFWIEIIYGVPQLRSMDTDFGILPMPKADETQTDYATYIHCGHASAVCVPITNEDLDLTGRILEDMCYQNYSTVRPEFYDTMLKGKMMRDNASEDMLDIIYRNISVDLSLVLGMSIDGDIRSAMIGNQTALASLFEKNLASYQKFLDAYVSGVEALQ